MSHGGGGDRWLVSYADFITLLMVLFVVLYAMSNVDVGKYKALAEGLSRGMGGSGAPIKVVDPGINTSGSGTGDTAPAPAGVEDAFPQRPTDSLDVASNLTQLLSQAGLDAGVSVQNNIEGVLLAVSENLLFQPGTADLSSDAYPTLDKIVAMLQQIENEVRVTAYTDDTPPTDPRYPTNWELTSARSAAIVRYFINQGLAPERFAAIGRGEYHPLFANDTPEHRALNRRAEITVVYTLDQQQYQLGPGSILNGGQTTP